MPNIVEIYTSKAYIEDLTSGDYVTILKLPDVSKYSEWELKVGEKYMVSYIDRCNGYECTKCSTGCRSIRLRAPRAENHITCNVVLGNAYGKPYTSRGVNY